MNHKSHLTGRATRWVALLAMLGGCGSVGEPASEVAVTEVSVTSVAPSLPVDYPPDGWYLEITIQPQESPQDQLKLAETVADYARSHGYPEARVLPDPDVPEMFLGNPQIGLSQGPGVLLLVLLSPDTPVPGPDPTTAATSVDELTAFLNGQDRQQVEAAAATLGSTKEALITSGAVDAKATMDFKPVMSYLQFGQLGTAPWVATEPPTLIHE